MPVWMTHLYDEIRKETAPLSLKIFLIKIVLNMPDVFEPYCEFWFEPLIDYASNYDKGPGDRQPEFPGSQ
jgi:hypothetical protein